MKLSPSFAVSFIVSTVPPSLAGASNFGHVYLDDPQSIISQPANPPTLDPHSARLVFAQRLGLSAYHKLGDVDEKTVNYLNAFGSPAPFFPNTTDATRLHAFLIIEGVDQPEKKIPSLSKLPSFYITDPPSQATDARLLADFMQQAHHSDCASPKSSCRNDNVLATLKDEDVDLGQSRSKIFIHRHASQDYANTLKSLRERKIANTVAFMPSSIKKNHKRTWGAYDTLSSIESRNERRAPDVTTGAIVPIPELASPTSAVGAFASPSPSASPVSGILPSCFASQSNCQSQTNNCTGHGQCNLKYGTGSSACWSCVCNIPDVRTNPDGTKKTTTFGGPACQKKDISVPFWLLAGFTIGMVAAIAAGIGMLFSIGSEELPSVIGAGVSGPRAK